MYKSYDERHTSKQHGLPFPNSQSTSNALFQLIHLDIWGTYSHSNTSSTPYMLTIVEDLSRATWTYLMTHKSQTYSILHQFLHMVQTKFHISVNTLRSDNGLEFLSLANTKSFP